MEESSNFVHLLPIKKEKKNWLSCFPSMLGGHVGNDYPGRCKPNGQSVKHKLQSTKP
jgi:hypothetical protein